MANQGNAGGTATDTMLWGTFVEHKNRHHRDPGRHDDREVRHRGSLPPDNRTAATDADDCLQCTNMSKSCDAGNDSGDFYTIRRMLN